MIYKQYETSQEAWEDLHHYFLNCMGDIEATPGGGRYGGQMRVYDMYIKIEKAWVLPEFDFGNTFGYRKQKWTTLVNNYVDRDELEILKREVGAREKKGSKNYQISMAFENKHKHGKNCLLSLTVSKRTKPDKIYLVFNLRSSEITKRLLMDFLLVQRIGEYIFGPDQEFGLICQPVNIYMNPEAFTMYDSYKSIRRLVNKKPKDRDHWQKRVLALLRKFKTIDVDKVNYKVHKRCVRQLQRPNGHPLSGDRPMLAKDLIL